MGVDVNIAVVGAVTDEQIEKFNLFLKARDGEHAAVWFDTEARGQAVGHAKRTNYEGHEWVEVMTLERYYGPGYERGRWPLIYATIIAARYHFPDATVHYGGDTDLGWENPGATDDHLAAVWAHWASAEGDAYHHHR